ncbi:P-loop NTPase fold protein [Pseudoduganella lutea]|uniref:P-loop NTPase fold protein n=1 Tax=Pseudoduganella lutea TaxID=321985 RepID=UPI0013EE9E41|nr:P-loop NTPase fold protein [Pseudoduganella lutea]
MDVFLAYNEREKDRIRPIADWFTSHGISNHFFDRDRPYGASVEDTPVMELAEAVVVFLGTAGWGPNHLLIVEKASALKKPVFPVLIGKIDEKDAQSAGRLFESTRWLDLRDGDLERLHDLTSQIKKLSVPSNFEVDAMVKSLAREADSKRRVILHRITDPEFRYRKALGAALIRELRAHDISTATSSSTSDQAIDPRVSARSWLRAALIHCQPEEPTVKDIAERGVNPISEPVHFVRFWTLAALVSVRASYLGPIARQAATDPAWDVALLAQALLGAGSPGLVAEMRSALTSGDKSKTHGALRALRIVSIPEVAPELAALLRWNSSVDMPAYDVFHALVTPDMVVPAANTLTSDPGIETVVGKMVQAAAWIDSSTAYMFARLLAAMDPRRSEELLRERESFPELQGSVKVLLESLGAISAKETEMHRQLPGFSPDTIDGQVDQLDIQSEVNTLTAIMMAKNTTPPLAIGLFGEWGAGKSFFMSKMEEAVKLMIERATHAKGSLFCADTVQIRFNAWHYADTSLWASLVSVIFENLDKHLRDSADSRDERDSLAEELLAAIAAKDNALVEDTRAQERLRQEEARLAVSASEREARLAALSRLQARDVASMFQNHPTFRKDAEKVLRDLGLPGLMSGIGDLNRALEEARSLSRRTIAMFSALSRDPAGRLWFCFLLLALLASPGLLYLIHRYLSPGSLIGATISTIFMESVAFIASATALLRRGSSLFAKALKPLEDAKKEADALLAKKREAADIEEKSLQDLVDKLRKEEQEAHDRLNKAVQQAAAAEQRLNQLDQSRTLGFFVAERRASSDYRKHMGLISVVRQDFELLVDRIDTNNKDITSGKKLERIILYIDDLDRCPSDKVVDVLQAVHLLLAYPLFVVVVGVDPRWLLNSLTLHYKELGKPGHNTGARSPENQSASPRHYLEKIFQIPYALRPMNRNGYGKLVAQLMSNGAPSYPTEASDYDTTSTMAASPSTAELNTATQLDERNSGTSSSHLHDSAGLPDQTAHYEAIATPKEYSPPEWVERALIIQPWEVEFAQKLDGLIPSPRSVKRLVNVYRVLKAGVHGTQLAQFEGVEDSPGDFQLPLLLLAVQIFDTSAANLWFTELVNPRGAAGNATLPAVLSRHWPGIATGGVPLSLPIGDIIDEPSFPQDPGLLAYWVPRVARLSFHAWYGEMRN